MLKLSWLLSVEHQRLYGGSIIYQSREQHSRLFNAYISQLKREITLVTNRMSAEAGFAACSLKAEQLCV
jgi:hypothetical protein